MASDWQTHPLETCMDAIIDYRGKTPKKTTFGIPLITAKIVKNGSIKPVHEFISEADYDEWMRRGIPHTGDVLLTTEAPLGEVAQLDNRKVALAQRLITLRGKSGLLDNTFLKFLMQSASVQDQLLARSSGTTVIGIKQKELRKILLPIPPFPEQRAIAHILGSLDDKIELNRRTNQTLEAMARAIFKSWFVDFDPVRAKAEGRDTGLPEEIADLFPDIFEDSALGETPKGWEVVPLPEIIDLNPKRKLKKGQMAPYLEMKNMPENSSRALDWYDREFGSGVKFMRRDTLMARITPCLENGKGAYVDFLEDGEVGWGSTEYIVFRAKKPLPSVYSYFLSRTADFRSHAIVNMTGSSGRQRVPASIFNSYIVTKPSKQVAEIFGTISGPIMQKIKKNDEEARTIASLSDTLLPKLISGDLRVPDAEKFVEEAGL